MSSKIEELLNAAESDANENSVSHAERTLPDDESASALFGDVKHRLLRIDNWTRNSTPSSYSLFGADGRPAGDRPIETGDFIRISLHGSGKYDWVRVENIYESASEFVITVRPSYDPTEQPIEKEITSHFFSSEATNNFCVRRSGPRVDFLVIGLNEKQNAADTGGVMETVRNVAAANLGSYLGIQKAVWTQFGKNFLEPETGTTA